MELEEKQNHVILKVIMFLGATEDIALMALVEMAVGVVQIIPGPVAGNGGNGKLRGGNGGYMLSRTTNASGGNGGSGYYPGKAGGSSNGASGSDGQAITSSALTYSFPLNGMTPTTSIVIIEPGNSIEDF